MKKLILILTGTVLFGFNAMAQSGTNPILGTTHDYTITIDQLSSTRLWEIDATDLSTVGWATITAATADGGTETVSITFNSPTFSAGTYTLRYTETLTNGCSTVREITITVQDNLFCLVAGGDASECHDLDGTVFDWAANGATAQSTDIEFTVDVTNGAALAITNWQFDGTLTLTNGDYTVTNVASSAGTVNNFAGTGPYTFDISAVPGATTSITLTVTVEGLVTDTDVFELALSNGIANVGAYAVPDNGTCDGIQVITVDPLPGASNISAD